MFVGRKTELDSLNRHYCKDKFQFAVFYGRRRVGKTTLINEFCKNKKSIYFVAVESTIKENLKILSQQIYDVIAPNAPRNPFPSFREAVDYIFEYAKHERVIFVIDEYPYLAESSKSVSSILQAAIDKHQSDSMLFLILCGSSMPFDYFECAGMLHGVNAEEKIVLYGITGGIPEYVSRIDNGISVQENVRELFFDPSGWSSSERMSCYSTKFSKNNLCFRGSNVQVLVSVCPAECQSDYSRIWRNCVHLQMIYYLSLFKK